MKKSLLLVSLGLIVSLSGCRQKTEDNRQSIDASNIENQESIEDEDISFDTYSGFSSEGQFELSIVDTSIRKFEDIEDANVVDNIKEKAKGKYVIYMDYIFEDKTIDTDFSYSSYKLSDLTPKAKSEDNKSLELVSATNVVPGLEGLKDNEEGIRAIFVSDEKLDLVEYNFLIVDKLDRENTFKIKLKPRVE